MGPAEVTSGRLSLCSKAVCTAEREREQDWHQNPRAQRHTQRHTQTSRHPQDTDQVALIVIVPVEFVRFLCHLEARQSGLRRQESHNTKRTLRKVTHAVNT